MQLIIKGPYLETKEVAEEIYDRLSRLGYCMSLKNKPFNSNEFEGKLKSKGSISIIVEE